VKEWRGRNYQNSGVCLLAGAQDAALSLLPLLRLDFKILQPRLAQQL
jgi:hypothetical protein